MTDIFALSGLAVVWLGTMAVAVVLWRRYRLGVFRLDAALDAPMPRYSRLDIVLGAAGTVAVLVGVAMLLLERGANPLPGA
ncbi:MAG: hypothetical protein H7840_10575 [Alphaproteobacteria bacterium]